MPDDILVKISKVSEKGRVQIPLEIQEKLGLSPGTKMIVYATEDSVVLRKAELVFSTQSQGGLLRKLRGIFSKVPIRDIEA